MATVFIFFIKESTRMQQALKKPEFRKLLAEYAQEISDPENKKVHLLARTHAHRVLLK